MLRSILKLKLLQVSTGIDQSRNQHVLAQPLISAGRNGADLRWKMEVAIPSLIEDVLKSNLS